jgi:pimeloyl-ACP methyl ester carboxylesterase
LPRPLLSKIDARVALQFAVVAVPGIAEMAVARRNKRFSVAQQVAQTLRLCTVDVSRIPQPVIDEGVRSIESRDKEAFAASDVLVAARSLMRILSRPQSLRRLLRPVVAPVLLLHGERDRLVSVDVARDHARAFPAWRLEIAPDVGHVPMLEAPDWTAATILDWLERDLGVLAS